MSCVHRDSCHSGDGPVASGAATPESECVYVYAIVRAGGRQEKVAVGDKLLVDKIDAEPGSNIELTPVLLVDGDKVTAGAEKLGKATVTAEIMKAAKGPKISIVKYKNKTGYRKRQGHRQPLTQIKITAINA